MCPPPFKASNSDPSPNYNEVLLQISTNLSNTLRTFGPSSRQYQTILQTLKEFLQEIDSHKSRAQVPASEATTAAKNPLDVDPDMLSMAMEFLSLGS